MTTKLNFKWGFYLILPLIIILFNVNQTQAQNREVIELETYATTKDFLEQNSSKAKLKIIKDGNLLVISNFKNRKYKDTWAVRYNDEYYFNLNHSLNLNRPGVYIKLDYVDEKSAYAYIDKKAYRNLLANNQLFIGIDQSAVVVDTPLKAAKTWKEKSSKRKKMFLFIDLARADEEVFEDVMPGNYLSAQYIKKHILKDASLFNADLNKKSAEEIQDIIANRRS